MTISSQIDFSVIVDNIKNTYAKNLKDYRPNFAVLQELLPANRDGAEMGQKIFFPVLLTHNGNESYDTAGQNTTLNAAAAIEIKDASTDQFEITERVPVPIGVLSKAAQSPKARFADPVQLRMFAGQKGAQRALELSLLHGANSVGQVSSLASVAGSGPWTRDVTFTVQSWSDGIWGAAENAQFDFWTALTSGTQHSGGTKPIAVSAVNFATRTVTFTTTTGGASTDLSAIVANDYCFAYGGYAKQMTGLMAALGTTSGNLFGLSTNYSMYKAKQVTVTGPLTFGKILSGIAPAVSHGAEGKLTALVSPKIFADLMKDLLSTKRTDSSYDPKSLKQGSQGLTYYYSGGVLEIVIHPYMKDGDCAVIPVDNWFRVGSDPDPTMDVAGLELQVMNPNSNSYEFRFFCASALIPNLLSTSTYFSGITPNAS